jgi:hypothetical protein
MFARPESKDVFLLGLGSGITGGAILHHPIEHLTIAENCEPVLRAAKFFEQWNAGVLSDKRTHLRIEDARTVLKLDPRLYDIIITQPSNPWMVGVGSVFSREYYELAATRLKENGIMAQWFHLYDMHDGIVAMVLRTFGTVFPHVEIWDTAAETSCCLARSALGLRRRNITRRSSTVKGQGRTGQRRPSFRQCFAGAELASQRTAFAIPGDGPIQSDLFPILEYEAPKAFYLGVSSSMLGQFDERTRQMDLAPPPNGPPWRSWTAGRSRKSLAVSGPSIRTFSTTCCGCCRTIWNRESCPNHWKCVACPALFAQCNLLHWTRRRCRTPARKSGN